MEKDIWTGDKVTNNNDAPKAPLTKVGIIERKTVNKLLSSLVGFAIVIAVFISILAIWDYVGADVAYKTVATLGTLIAGGVAFGLSNDYFGARSE